MGIITTSRRYTNSFRPQDLNIDWLLGNTGVWQTLKFTFHVETRMDFTSNAPLFMEQPNVFTLTDGSTWQQNGFTVGDSFEMGFSTTEISTGTTTDTTITGIITQFVGNTMYSDNTTVVTAALLTTVYPTQLGEYNINSVYVRANKQPQGIEFQYGHIRNANNQSNDLSSYIDGTNTIFNADDLASMTIGQVKPMTPMGLQSGMSIEKATIKYFTQIDFRYYYTIELTFMVNSFFDDASILTNSSPEVTTGSNSLTDNFRIRAYTVYNNPNVFLENDMATTRQLGNTGWFNENYNGLPNDFTISAFEYRNAANTIVQQLDYQNPIKVRAVIEGVQNISSLTRCSYGFVWQPIDDSYYKGLPEPFYKNLKVSTGGGIQTTTDTFNVSNTIDTALRLGYSSDGASMDVTNVRFQETGTNQITFEAEFIPNAAFSAFMSGLSIDERNYKIWVNIADQSEVTNLSNRVSLELDYRQLDTYIEPIGAYTDMSIGFLTHSQDETGTPSACGDDIIIEDGLSAKIEFLIDTDVSPTIPIPTGLEYGILIQRNSDGLQYKLDQYPIDLGVYPSVTQYNYTATRGFKLIAGDNKNEVRAEYYPAIDTGTKLGVLGLYSFKIRWEDWINRSNMPIEVRNAFFDNAKEQNGLNNNWYHYLSTAGWTLYFYVLTDATLNGTAVRYENLKPLVFNDYNENTDITVGFVYKRASDGTVLSGGIDPVSGLPLGVILDDEKTLLEITYTRTSGTWLSLANTYGISAIEVYQGAGQFEYRQLSSIIGSEVNNPLIPITGATLLDLVLVSPTEIKASCLIDPTNLIQSNRYKITGRIGCK